MGSTPILRAKVTERLDTLFCTVHEKHARWLKGTGGFHFWLEPRK